MIGRLKGLYDGQSEDHAIIDCGGVGYRVFASSRTLGQLGPIGQAVTLEIETQVREDHIHLFGFLSEQERDLFRLLQTVQGVGAKVALAVLSAMTADQLIVAIGAGDKAMVQQVKGIGPKAAQRIVTELKDKVGAFAHVTLGAGGAAVSGAPAASGEAQAGAAGSGILSDVTSALTNLGYQRSAAFEAASKAVAAIEADGAEPSVEAAIVAGLKILSAS